MIGYEFYKFNIAMKMQLQTVSLLERPQMDGGFLKLSTTAINK